MSERMADAEVSLHSDGSHDECREGDDGSDEEVVGSTQEVAARREVSPLEGGCRWNDERTREEVERGEDDNEEAVGSAVHPSTVEEQHKHVSDHSNEREDTQHRHDDALLQRVRSCCVYVRDVSKRAVPR